MKELIVLKKSVFFLLLVSIGVAFGSDDNLNSVVESQRFADYWYQGKAELNRYELKQARYGEIHEGDAVLIFVTEDFLTDKQVKLEHGKSENATTVMKLNFTRKFFTGIYPYSILTSIFSPVDLQNWGQPLKVSNTNQEWCGHAYVQMNLRDGAYQGVSHSYFQDEADQKFEIGSALLEDEIWTRIRLNPDFLPVGDIEILPALLFIRLRHLGFDVQKANAELSTVNDPDLSTEPIRIYIIDYTSINRKLTIKFESKFPFSILAWEETYRSGWGAGAKELTTRAKRTHTIITDYWTKNSEADSTYRKKLGLEIQH